MITALTLVSLFGIFYAYFGYPIVLRMLVNRGVRTPFQPTTERPQTLSVIIAARNERAVIAEKLENTLALDAPERISSDRNYCRLRRERRWDG
jgi:biofilm PGA synthesis N-glycosyltransferase PgaC